MGVGDGEERGGYVRAPRAGEQVADDLIGLDWAARLQIAVHGRRQRRTLRGQQRSYFREEGFAGAWPAAVATAATSSRKRLTKSLPPGAATISPTLPRIRQVMPASDASITHFSHISCSIAGDSRASKPAFCMKASSSLDALGAGAVQLAIVKLVEVSELDDPALLVELGRDPADAAGNRVLAEARGYDVHDASCR